MQKVLSTTFKALILGAGLCASVQAASQTSALLVYRVWEPGLDPYISRILVTPEYLRIDEGEGTKDYTLFDRDQEIIYNVSYDDRAALVMNPPLSDLKQPSDLKLDQRVSSDPKAPKISGLTPQHVSLLANGKVCREMVTVPGLMPDAMEALRDFQAVLARVQAATLGNMQKGMESPCDLAENVYAPLRQLDHGLPIQERTPHRSRSLVDFVTDHQVDDSLFTIPKDYDRAPMPGLSHEQ
jgi:hypothetical protein